MELPSIVCALSEVRIRADKKMDGWMDGWMDGIGWIHCVSPQIQSVV